MLALADKHGVAAFVIGLPLNMDGTEGPRAQSTRAFVRQTAPLALRPFAFWDERLSTAAVTRDLIANDVSRGNARKSWIAWPRPIFCKARSTACPAYPGKVKKTERFSPPVF